MKTDISKLDEVLKKELDEWSIQTTIKLSDAVLDTTIEASKEIKKLTPRGAKRRDGKDYRDCFVIKPNRSKSKNLLERTLFNEQYQLSHLLEDGHKVYTRNGKKTDPNAVKVGPLDIKKRSAKNGGTYAVFSDSKHTAKYSNWYHTRKLAEEHLVKDIKDKLSQQ
ncbi:MAG: hypothetical protein KBT03_11520 [Bacteroidales bacterium]|nr:hypothetical protein [Candidatus Scybalousia scybalohippi]